jgi:uncharacterized membrane protein
VGLELAALRFRGQETAALRYADAKDRSGSSARWAQEVGFVERHHGGRLALRGTFAGHYLDIDESDHVSQQGAGEGAVAAGLIGVLGGPPGIALGILLGGVLGAELGPVSDAEPEPLELADKLRAAVPRSSSAVVMVAEAADVDAMLAAFETSAEDVVRRALTTDEQARLEAALSAAPAAEG